MLSPGKIQVIRIGQYVQVNNAFVKIRASRQDTLEPFLQVGERFDTQFLFELDLKTQRRLCEQYYAINDMIFREIVSSKTKQTAKEVSESTQINLAICERNSANFRRISDAVNDAVATQVDPLPRLRHQFRISDSLARRYFRSSFIGFHNWNVAKKRVAHLSYLDIEQVAGRLFCFVLFCFLLRLRALL